MIDSIPTSNASITPVLNVPLATRKCWPRIVLLLTVAALLRSDGATHSPYSYPFRDPAEGPLDHRHVAVIVNEADPLSEAIGRYYKKARDIPDDQVIRVRFEPSKSNLSYDTFIAIQRLVRRKTPAHIQVYALAWAAPYRVGCQSITSAFTLGWDPGNCATGCHNTRISPYYARGNVRRPWDELKIRPTMLIAARDLGEARRLIDRGVAADGTAPAGTAYLVTSDDAKRNVRSQRYRFIASAIPSTFRVRIVRQKDMIGVNDIMAYFTGAAQVPNIRTNTFRVGAIADHLTSFGGMLTDSPQMSAMQWLEAGATGSYGTVVEPCNISSKFPDPGLILSYYLRGDTLIESYWRSVAMPGQGVFIGEPLARPWPWNGRNTPVQPSERL